MNCKMGLAMKICIPSMEDQGLKSAVSQHFGRAPFHYVVDTATREIELMAKPEGEHGACVPAHALMELGVETVLCVGIGRGAAMNFASSGIPVMRTNAATIEAAVAAFEGEQLSQIAESDLCAGHGAGDHDHCD